MLRDAVLPYLHELGERWQRGEASIGQEHFASVLLRGRLLGLARGWGSGGSRRALLACLPGEQHDLGLICFGLALRGQGWRITFLGPDTPLATIGDTVRLLHPVLVVVTATDHAHFANAADGLAEVARDGPAGARGRRRERRARDGARRRVPRGRSRRRRRAHIRPPPCRAPGFLVARPALTGWSSTERTSPDGSVQFEQRVRATRPLVELSERGALALGERYWPEVEACTRRLVRARRLTGEIDLRLLGRWTLLRFGAPQTIVDASGALCRYPIIGGLLARTPRGLDHVRAGGRAGGRAARDDRRLPAAPQRSALPPRAAAHPHQRQPALLPAPDRGGAEMRVVVFGATGTIGAALVPVLAREHDVVAVSRRARPAAGDGVEWVRADASDASSVRAALEGADVAYYLVHSLGSGDFERRDRTAAETVAREASAAGLRQIVYLGGLGDDSPDLSPHLRSRIETGVALASGSVPVTTLRAAMVIGSGSAAFETILALVDRLPAMICPRWVSTPTQPIALEDVVHYLAAACGREEFFGETFDVGGAEVMTYREMIEQIGRLRGRRPLIVEVPVLTPRLSSYWLRLVTPVGAGVARPLIEGLRTETIVRDARIRELVPFELTPFGAAVHTRSRRPLSA